MFTGFPLSRGRRDKPRDKTRGNSDGDEEENQSSKIPGDGEETRQESGEARGQETGGKSGQRKRPAAALGQAVRRGRQGARRRTHSRLQPRAGRPDLHPAPRLHGRRRDQGRTAGRGRHHARPAARRKGRRQPLLHHAQRQQALDHDRLQAPQGQGNPRPADQILRRAGRELRPGHARPHGAHLGAHPQAQPAHDRRLGQGLRAGAVRGLQGLRERRAMRGRLGVHHRLPRGPAARHRRADRRFRHRPASRLRHRVRALPAHAHRARSRAGSSSARAGRPIPTPTSISSPRRRCGARSAT